MALANFFNTPRSNLIPSIIEFPSIDTEGLQRKLKLKEKAKEQGSKNLPAEDSEGLDPVENEIINEIQKTGREQYDAYLQHQKTYIERATDSSVKSQVLRISAIASSAKTDFQRQTHIGTGDLYARKRAVIQTENELTNFRRRHRLERPPRDYGSKTLKFWILVLIVALEAAFNGLFLSKGSEFGFVGGTFLAVIIAAMNVTFGAGTGRFIAPWITYRNRTIQVLAAIGLIVYLAVAFGFNLAVAHYRSAVTGDPFEASIVAYHHFVADPFAIEDFESWALFIMGFLFSLFAAYDGWRMDDPYPGYGQRMRHNLDSLAEYNDLKEELLADLDEIKKKAEDEMDDLVRSITSRQGEFANIVLRSEALRIAMGEFFDHLESAANALLSFYRNENQKHRTAPPPTRFKDSSRWIYPRPALEKGIESEEGRKGIDEALREALKRIPEQREALQEAFRNALLEYKRIDDLVKIEDSTLTGGNA